MKAGENIRLASESIRLQKERNVVLQQHNEILLFSSAPEGCNTDDAVSFSIYFEMKGCKRRVLE